MQVQKGQWNKNCGTKTADQKQWNKIGGNCQTLGGGDPKYKCTKVSRTKTAEQKTAE